MTKPCPACGYVEETTNYRLASSNLLKLRGGSVAKKLRNTVSLIVKYIPSERSQKKIYMFFQSISKIDDEKVRYGLIQYLNSRRYMEQKGFAYLRTIIMNVDKDSEMKKKMERKRFGTSPKETV